MTAASRRNGRLDRIIEPIASGLGNGVAWLAENGILFVIFTAIWLGFAIGLIWSQESLDRAWQAIRSWPLILQIVTGILFLPVVVGLWIWETSWPVVVRLVLIVGIAGWNLWMFLPRAVRTVKP